MGAWGTALFAGDEALDARDGFLDLLARHQDVPRARIELLRRAGVLLDHPGDATAFILGLAVTQWRNGWLEESVKAAAIEIIDGDLDVCRWEQPGDQTRRQKVLDKVRSNLLSSGRKPKTFPKPPPVRLVRHQLEDVKIGEIVCRRLPSGRLAVMKAVEFREIENWNVVAPVVRLLKWTSLEMPSTDEAQNLEALRWPVRPDGVVAFTKLSLATPNAEQFGDLLRPGWVVDVGEVPKSGLTTSECLRTMCSIDEVLEYALARWWAEPSLPADARPPWAMHEETA
jgi:hypothetical protein